VETLTNSGCQTRCRRLRKQLFERETCDLLIVASPSELIRLANYHPSPFVFNSVGAGALLLVERERSVLFSDNVSLPFLDKAFVDEVIAPVWYNGKKSAGERRQTWESALLDYLAGRGDLRSRLTVGIEPRFASTGLIDKLRDRTPDLRTFDLEPSLVRSRRKKDQDELALMRRSIAAGDAGHAAALERIAPGMSELEAYNLVRDAACDCLGEQAIVYGDFVSGSRTDLVGGPPSSKMVKKGERFLLDFSVVVHGYRGDFANTFIVDGRPSETEQSRNVLCLEAISAGEKLLGPGVRASEVDLAVRSVFVREKKDKWFPSHVGHGLGLAHPEAPFIVPESEEILEAGDIVTLEPGQYEPGVVGMRYERNYLITDSGFELLSKHELRLE
jgi:Xaa-Pro aminopeptidase